MSGVRSRVGTIFNTQYSRRLRVQYASQRPNVPTTLGVTFEVSKFSIVTVCYVLFYQRERERLINVYHFPLASIPFSPPLSSSTFSDPFFFPFSLSFCFCFEFCFCLSFPPSSDPRVSRLSVDPDSPLETVVCFMDLSKHENMFENASYFRMKTIVIKVGAWKYYGRIHLLITVSKTIHDQKSRNEKANRGIFTEMMISKQRVRRLWAVVDDWFWLLPSNY